MKKKKISLHLDGFISKIKVRTGEHNKLINGDYEETQF